jgi:hypothetical protein
MLDLYVAAGARFGSLPVAFVARLRGVTGNLGAGLCRHSFASRAIPGHGGIVLSNVAAPHALPITSEVI